MNPFIRIYESPVESLTAAGWLCILIGALVATWWAAGRNALYLENNYQNGWKYLVPFWYAVRLVGMLVALAVDLWLVAGIIAVIA